MSQKVACVAAILRNLQGQILLQQRNDEPSVPFAGYWTLPGGIVEDGEEPDVAVSREVMEEIELEVSLRLWKVYERPGPKTITVVQYIYTGKTDRSVSSLALNEGQALRYVDATELGRFSVAYGFDSLLAEYFAKEAVAVSDEGSSV